MFGFQLKELARVPLGHLSARWRLSSTSAIRHWKPSMCPDTRRAAWCTIARQTTACSRDVLFQGQHQTLPTLPAATYDELIEHICSRLFILPNDTIVYPGHGAPTTIGIEKRRIRSSGKIYSKLLNQYSHEKRPIGLPPHRHQRREEEKMLQKIGVKSLDEAD